MGTVVVLPFLGMVMAECAQVGLIIVSKKVMSQGMSSLVFVFFSNSLAALLLLPSSLLVHRLAFLSSHPHDISHNGYCRIEPHYLKIFICVPILRRSERPPITISTLCGFLSLGLLGYLAQVFGYAGIYYSSATLSSALLNLVPGFTFILAVAFGMERLDWRSYSSLAKSLGTIVSIAGAFVATLYKGPALLTRLSPANSSPEQLFSQESNFMLGGLFLAADCVMASAYIIVQAKTVKKYPAELIIVFFYCFFVAILSGVTCLFLERDASAWSLQPKLRLLAVLYSGVFGSAFHVGVNTWCLHQTGPVFVSMFKPLGIVISVVAGVIFLGDSFYLGSLVGATVIVVGFYSVLWGKARDNEDAAMGSSESSGENTPLLK